MKKVLFVAAIALCAMSCGNKACENTEAQAEEVAVEAVVEEEAAPAEEEAVAAEGEAVVEEVVAE